jgi:hypothetical protein
MNKLTMRVVGVSAGAIMGLSLLVGGGVAGAGPAVGNTPARCAKAPAALALIQKAEARITSGLPKLTKAEQTARANGNNGRANRLERQIARLESTKFGGRLAKMAQRIEKACNLSA